MPEVRALLLLAVGSLTLGCVEQTFTPPYGAPPPGWGYLPPPQAPLPPGYAGAPGWGPAPPSAAPGWGPAPPSAAPGLSPGAWQAVAFAQSRLGTPYCWGGGGPRCYDCSGLTRASWLAGGRAIPRTSEAQLAALAPVHPAAVQPGDILWRPGHVGLYVGQGWAIAATHTGDFVRYQRADHFVRAVRP